MTMRRNLLDIDQENWKPPAYGARPGPFERIKLFFLRFLDLQSGSILRDLRRELPKVRGEVLDVGCGLQPFRGLFTEGTRYRGLDSADSKAHFGYETPDTTYYSSDVWPVKDGAADFILCTETLEHIPEPLVFLKQAFRVLKPGGRLLLTVPFAVRWHFIPYDYWRYTPSGLDRLLARAGFEEVRVHARGNVLTVACYKVMAFFFALLSPVTGNGGLKALSLLLGILGSPVLLAATVLANLSLGVDGTVDCLGYTVLAEKSRSKARRGGKINRE